MLLSFGRTTNDGYPVFATSTAIVFKQNATELAEQRFKISAVTAGWYAALSQYAGFFVVPLVAVFIDVYGQRITLSKDPPSPPFPPGPLSGGNG